MNVVKLFFGWACIICVLLGTSHLLNVFSPFIGLSSNLNESNSFSTNPNDVDAEELVDLYVFMTNYDMENYDPEDFPDWLYMPNNSSGNLTEDDIKPYGGYNWSEYNVGDFPDWLDMPATLPENFTADDFDMMDYMDPEFMDQVESEMMNSENPFAAIQQIFSSESGVDTSQILNLISSSDLIRAILFFTAAIILFIIARLQK